jgi:hypothetical protein
MDCHRAADDHGSLPEHPDPAPAAIVINQHREQDQQLGTKPALLQQTGIDAKHKAAEQRRKCSTNGHDYKQASLHDGETLTVGQQVACA